MDKEQWKKDYEENFKGGIQKFMRRTGQPLNEADSLNTLDMYVKFWKPLFTLLGLRGDRAREAMDLIAGELLDEVMDSFLQWGVKGDHEFRPYYAHFADSMLGDVFRSQHWDMIEERWQTQRGAVPVSYRFLIGVLAQRATEGSVEDLRIQFGPQMKSFDTFGPEWRTGKMLSPTNRALWLEHKLFTSTNPRFPELDLGRHFHNGPLIDDIRQLVLDPSAGRYNPKAMFWQELNAKVFWDPGQVLPNIKNDGRYLKIIRQLKELPRISATEGEQNVYNGVYNFVKSTPIVSGIKREMGNDPYYHYYFNRNYNPAHLARLKVDELYARESADKDRFIRDAGLEPVFQYITTTLSKYGRDLIATNLQVHIDTWCYTEDRNSIFLVTNPKMRTYRLAGGGSIVMPDALISDTVEWTVTENAGTVQSIITHSDGRRRVFLHGIGNTEVFDAPAGIKVGEDMYRTRTIRLPVAKRDIYYDPSPLSFRKRDIDYHESPAPVGSRGIYYDYDPVVGGPAGNSNYKRRIDYDHNPYQSLTGGGPRFPQLPIEAYQFWQSLAQIFVNQFEVNQGDLYEKFKGINPVIHPKLYAPNITREFRHWFNTYWSDVLDSPIDPNDPFLMGVGTQSWGVPDVAGPNSILDLLAPQSKRTFPFSLREPFLLKKK